MRKLAVVLFFYFIFNSFTNAAVVKEYSSSHYKIKAKDIPSLLAEVKHLGPKYDKKSAWALLKWDLIVEFSYRSNELGCKVFPDKVTVVANTDLPTWQDVESTKNASKSWWKNFYLFIDEHENKHLNNVYLHSVLLEEKLLKGAYFTSCIKAKLNYLDLKYATLTKIKNEDLSIDKIAMKQFNSNTELFSPLKSANGGLVIESGLMRSFIGF